MTFSRAACLAIFFYLHNDIDAPEEGHELPYIEAVRAQGASQAREMIGELVKEDGRIVLHHRIDIEDATGKVLSSVWFSDLVSVEQLDRS